MLDGMTNIKASEVLKELKFYTEDLPHYSPDEVAEALEMAIKSLDQRWIPVSERLPERSGDYLVTTQWKGSYSGDVYIETNMAVYRKKQEEWDCVGVIAWMPLPEPMRRE